VYYVVRASHVGMSGRGDKQWSEADPNHRQHLRPLSDA
jgi:hypothetical protein